MSVRRLEPELPHPHRAIRPRSPAEMLEPSRAPARPKGRRRRREGGSFGRWVRFISGLLTAVVLLMAAGGIAAFVLQHQYTTAGPLSEARTVIVPRGEGRLEIAERLEQEGIISSRWAFIINHLVRSMVFGERLDMKAGEYELAAGASMQKVLDTLVEGRSVQYKATVPEGLTSQQVVARLQADENLTGDILTIPAEGSLLPDTYPYARGTERQAVLDRMAQAQRDFIAGLWETRQQGLPINTMEEAIILASIVEKETAVAEERAMTAAVFMNRLRKGMRLQSDPTIIYGIVGGQGRLGRSITKDDIRGATPYNTYTINGLPPTPICNPGREAILAVLNPASTSALYFVADGTGGHTFSDTLAEHNAAVAKWRQIERDRRNDAASKTRAAPSPVSTVASEAPEAAPPVAESPVTDASVSTASAIVGGMPLPQRKPK